MEEHFFGKCAENAALVIPDGQKNYDFFSCLPLKMRANLSALIAKICKFTLWEKLRNVFLRTIFAFGATVHHHPALIVAQFSSSKQHKEAQLQFLKLHSAEIWGASSRRAIGRRCWGIKYMGSALREKMYPGLGCCNSFPFLRGLLPER